MSISVSRSHSQLTFPSRSSPLRIHESALPCFIRPIPLPIDPLIRKRHHQHPQTSLHPYETHRKPIPIDHHPNQIHVDRPLSPWFIPSLYSPHLHLMHTLTLSLHALPSLACLPAPPICP
ncbi:hypothetical protein BT63DRAFT_421755 [Microthyrium microscopicum]|uniref:Uncharacterized protein n=1 Tax=Microthyrium microscopicum TaxID=703497 RepID=A0A6A6UQC4_9PEZI|nr:hypothetical protein BT63DRAFT_421755 [Microthyrium microscopicum]